jgi:hypothetical protein
MIFLLPLVIPIEYTVSTMFAVQSYRANSGVLDIDRINALIHGRSVTEAAVPEAGEAGPAGPAATTIRVPFKEQHAEDLSKIRAAVQSLKLKGVTKLDDFVVVLWKYAYEMA